MGEEDFRREAVKLMQSETGEFVGGDARRAGKKLQWGLLGRTSKASASRRRTRRGAKKLGKKKKRLQGALPEATQKLNRNLSAELQRGILENS